MATCQVVKLSALFVFFALLGLSQASDGASATGGCSKDVKPVAGMVGGWSKMTDTDMMSLNEELKALSLVSFSQYVENESNDIQSNIQSTNLSPDDISIKKVYSQIVAGTNYCIVFSHCSSKKAGVCQEKSRKCEAKVYQPLPYMVQDEAKGPEVKSIVCD